MSPLETNWSVLLALLVLRHLLCFFFFVIHFFCSDSLLIHLLARARLFFIQVSSPAVVLVRKRLTRRACNLQLTARRLGEMIYLRLRRRKQFRLTFY